MTNQLEKPSPTPPSEEVSQRHATRAPLFPLRFSNFHFRGIALVRGSPRLLGVGVCRSKFLPHINRLARTYYHFNFSVYMESTSRIKHYHDISE
jgi:hypothetical protein